MIYIGNTSPGHTVLIPVVTWFCVCVFVCVWGDGVPPPSGAYCARWLTVSAAAGRRRLCCWTPFAPWRIGTSVHRPHRLAAERCSCLLQWLLKGLPYLGLNGVRRREVHLTQTEGTSLGGRMSRAPTSHSRRSGNPKIVGSSLEPACLKAGWVKSMT